MSADSVTKARDVLKNEIESFSVASPWLRQSDELRLDASFYNPRLAEALSILRHSGLTLKRLSDVTKRIFIPPRFKRIYVKKTHGVPFLQGSHIVHFQPADIKYLSLTAHKRIERWLIESGWVLVTCSGTIGRVAIAPPSWHLWAASQHILRIVPEPNGPCPAGYISAYLSSELGQAQLTSRIYGAVVDEITEEQASSVLIPIPQTAEQKRLVAKITGAALESVRAKDIALRLAQESSYGIAELIPALKPEGEEAEDAMDIETARARLAELKTSPERLVQGEALKKRLSHMDT
jgi:Type I restriction modification DNA specificity domain